VAWGELDKVNGKPRSSKTQGFLDKQQSSQKQQFASLTILSKKNGGHLLASFKAVF